MNRPLSNIVDIKPQPRRQWTVLVQVIENGNVQQSRTGGDFKRIVLTDGQGTKLSSLIYSNHLCYFANLLTPYKKYYISNAMVIKNDTRYQIGSHPYSWIFNNRTLVEERIEPVPPTLPCEFHFTNCHDLHKHADTDNLQNVRAVVLQYFPSKDQGLDIVTRRDLVIVNEEKKLLLLTLWNEFDENEGRRLANIVNTAPMIFAMRVKVTTFNFYMSSTRNPIRSGMA